MLTVVGASTTLPSQPLEIPLVEAYGEHRKGRCLAHVTRSPYPSSVDPILPHTTSRFTCVFSCESHVRPSFPDTFTLRFPTEDMHLRTWAFRGWAWRWRGSTSSNAATWTDTWQRCLEFLFQASVGTATALCTATAVAHCSPSDRARQGGRNTIPTQPSIAPPRSVRPRVSGRPAPPVGWGGSARNTQSSRTSVFGYVCARGGERG